MDLSQVPSLNLLRGFEAAGRHGSFSEAAEELGVTQGAVSRQIKSLEEALGVQLFDRSKRVPELTLAGRSYWEAVRRSFRELHAATQRLTEDAASQAVTVSVLPTFAMRWLIPRLSEFQAIAPEVDVRVMTSGRPGEAESGRFDVAVDFSLDPLPAAEGEFLVDEVSVAVCHPELVRGRSAVGSKDVLEYTLLDNSTRPLGWDRWFAHMGVDPESPPKRVSFRHFYLTIQAALNRIGVALVPHLYVEQELRSGHLVAPFGTVASGWGSYFLIPATASSEASQRFREWLVSAAQAAMRPDLDPGRPMASRDRSDDGVYNI